MAISVAGYLGNSYHPDCDYIDGEVIERNFGEYDHGRTQGNVAYWLKNHEDRWSARAVLELRIQISSERFRVTDAALGELPIISPCCA